MMTSSDSDTQTVEQCTHIHVMNISYQEADNSIFTFLLTKKSDSIDGFHLFHTVAGQLLLVLGDVVHTESRDIIDGFCQTMSSHIVRSSSLELKRQLLKSGLLEAHTFNHFASSLVWR